MSHRFLWALALVALAGLRALAGETKFELKPGDHVCIIGNALAERMQHDGYLEALLHTLYPDNKLVVRNMGFGGDTLTTRLRSMDFGTPDQWLAGRAPVPQPSKLSPAAQVPDNRFEAIGTNADVIFAFFGGNEAWEGEEGLPKFKKDLADWLDHTLSQKYNGKSAPRVVLFSPIAHENLRSPHLPDGKQHNALIKLYTDAMREIAGAKGVRFVDLFQYTSDPHKFSLPTGRMTINGIHPTTYGNKLLADIIARDLFRNTAPIAVDEKLRTAVRDKNYYWWNRYRAVDGYSTYGDRAFLKFTRGQTNYEVVQRELQVIDEMVAARDQVIWAAARGKEVKPDERHLLPFVAVVTNKPGQGPNGTHLYLGGEEALKSMTPGKNLKLNLFADEKMFPEMANPVQMQFDSKGRLWVATWPTYPHWKPTEQMNDKLIILEDTDGDGKADKCTTFADGLHNPTGFEFVPGGVLIAQCPDIMLLKDTNGDDKVDSRERVLHGFDTADTHHTSNSFAVDPAGAVYWQEGTFHHTQVESPYGPVRRNVNAGVYRYEPRTQKLDVYVPFGFANPHGHAFDSWGRDIVIDGTGSNPYDAALFSGHLDYPNKHARPPQVYQQRTRPCGGLEFLSSSAFPAEYRDNLLVTNVIGVLGLLRYKITEENGMLKGTELEPLVTSTDQNFRPVDVKTGPDGAVYFIDWQNPIIGHMQHNLRDPSRDRKHGRVYRISYDGKTVASPKIAGEPIPALLAILKHPDNRVRARARGELANRMAKDVLPALQNWVTTLPDSGEGTEPAYLEALWLSQSFDKADGELLARVLASPDARARAAAVRVLAQWRDRLPDALGSLRKLAADPSPRVRVEAVRAASFFATPAAIEVVLIAREQPTDKAVEFVAGETLKALNPLVVKAVREGRKVEFATPTGRRFFLKSVDTADLIKMARGPEVAGELLTRPGVLDDVRRDAADMVAAASKEPAWKVVADALQAQDRPDADESVTYDLTRLLAARPDELPAARPVMERLATAAKSATLRQLAYAGLVAADNSPDKAWELAKSSPERVADFAAAISAIRDPGQRAAAYPIALSILSAESAVKTASVPGRFVRIELPGRQRTLTLAEVEVVSDGKNVARGKPCKQSSTSNGGVAGRAVDGNKSGSYRDNGQTHTAEAQPNPWWEVDLGGVFPIEAVMVYNRTDTNLNARLDNFKLTVFDAKHQVVFVKENNPSPDVVGRVAVAPADPARVARAQAMLALTTVRGKEVEAVKLLAGLVGSRDQSAAIHALQRVPIAIWPKEVAPDLVAKLTKFVAGVPESDKTLPATLDALQLADAATTLLPRDQAKAARKALGEVGVRVVRVGTITDQMRFDRDRLVVQAGKPVEFVFANTDLMPHNFVVTRMGALVEVGEMAEAFGVTKGALEKDYVPPSNKILLASKLLQPGGSQSLRFAAPTEPGVYPYVCTYPGHWRRMYGALYVVDNLDDYLADPTAYVAAHPVSIADDMLKLNKPRTEWTLGELAPAVADMGPRSFANGRQLFTVGTCVSCHQFGGQGQNFGPDLAKLDKSVFKSPEDVLKHILEPSLRIEDKYKNFTFNQIDGTVVTGMVLDKTPAGDYKVIENPLAKAEPRTVRAADLDSPPKPSAVSIMPKGLLDQFTKDEILDLVAYVWGAADPKAKAFGAAHDHHGH